MANGYDSSREGAMIQFLRNADPAAMSIVIFLGGIASIYASMLMTTTMLEDSWTTAAYMIPVWLIGIGFMGFMVIYNPLMRK